MSSARCQIDRVCDDEVALARLVWCGIIKCIDERLFIAPVAHTGGCARRSKYGGRTCSRRRFVARNASLQF